MNNKLEQIAKFAYSHKETVLHTYNTASSLIEDMVHGCFVECGVGAGAQIAAMQLANHQMKANRTIWGFDSFQGIPLAGPNDTEQPGIGTIKHDVNLSERDRLVSSGITVHAIDNVQNNLDKVGIYPVGIRFVDGWFQDTLPKFANVLGDIAFLRLDGDLYESTICCLENLYPLVVDGGVVVVDDWGLPGARKAVEDYFGDKLPEIKIVEGSGTVAFFIK
jgi:O-methyltransferase